MKNAFVIAGVGSASGKSVITMGLLAAFRQRGLQVKAFKAGPDFIDPAHHARISGQPSSNLDSVLTDDETVRQIFRHETTAVDLGVIEGVMGCYDCKLGSVGTGSTAQLAALLELPVILVIDVKHMADTAAAVARGIFGFGTPPLRWVGVILNRVGSAQHHRHLQAAFEREGIPILGTVPTDPALAIDSRHLGLHTAAEQRAEKYAEIGRIVGGSCDLDKILAATGVSPRPETGAVYPVATARRKLRVAVARDRAFQFYYFENLKYLRARGAELTFFSILANEPLPAGTELLYLGGGYPELHGPELAAAAVSRASIRDYLEADGIGFAECGGLMYLGAGIRTTAGDEIPGVGFFNLTFAMTGRRQALGYFDGRFVAATSFGKPGDTLKGHEYHWSEIVADGGGHQTVLELTRGGETHRDGYLKKNTLGTYLHVHFLGNRGFADRLLDLAGKGGGGQ